MGKKRRKPRTTVYVSLEGKREFAFYEFVHELYSPLGDRHITPDDKRGGTSDVILERAIKNSHFDKSFAWFDEDIRLGDDIRNKLSQCWRVSIDPLVPDKELQSTYNSMNRNPILIVSHPCSFDGAILSLLGSLPAKPSTANCKRGLAGLIGCNCDSEKEKEYYHSHITREQLEKSAHPTIQLILSIFRDKNK